ncbi:MAG: hypothetical protein U0350_02460 [Caldilineaceae bacterium]
MTNNSNIHIENHVSVNQSGHDYTTANAGCAGLTVLGTLAGVAALGFGLYLVAEPALELALDMVFAVGDMLDAVGTAAIDLAVATGHLLKVLAVPTLWTVGYGCLALGGVALLSAAYSRLQEWRQDRTEAIRVIEQPTLPAPRVLVLVANTAEQAQAAINLLPESASVEFIEMPVFKDAEYAQNC